MPMPIEPGSRVPSICKGCGAKIVKILTENYRWGPFDLIPMKADGKRLLIFPDGTTRKHHPMYEIGHQSHFATCPKAGEFRNVNRKAGSGSPSRGRPRRAGGDLRAGDGKIRAKG